MVAFSKLRRKDKRTRDEDDENTLPSKRNEVSNEALFDLITKMRSELQNMRSDVSEIQKVMEGNVPDSALSDKSASSAESQMNSSTDSVKISISNVKWLADSGNEYPEQILQASARGLRYLELVPKIRCARNIPSKSNLPFIIFHLFFNRKYLEVVLLSIEGRQNPENVARYINSFLDGKD